VEHHGVLKWEWTRLLCHRGLVVRELACNQTSHQQNRTRFIERSTSSSRSQYRRRTLTTQNRLARFSDRVLYPGRFAGLSLEKLWLVPFFQPCRSKMLLHNKWAVHQAHMQIWRVQLARCQSFVVESNDCFDVSPSQVHLGTQNDFSSR